MAYTEKYNGKKIKYLVINNLWFYRIGPVVRGGPFTTRAEAQTHARSWVDDRTPF